MSKQKFTKRILKGFMSVLLVFSLLSSTSVPIIIAASTAIGDLNLIC